MESWLFLSESRRTTLPAKMINQKQFCPYYANTSHEANNDSSRRLILSVGYIQTQHFAQSSRRQDKMPVFLMVAYFKISFFTALLANINVLQQYNALRKVDFVTKITLTCQKCFFLLSND